MTGAAKPLTFTPSYLAMMRGTHQLHRLMANGQDDSPEAEAIRDATDGPWAALSEVERNRVRNLSEDLYSLHEPPPIPQPLNPQAQAKLTETHEAWQRGEWDRALDLLRRWRAQLDPAEISHLRGSIWLSAGDPMTAALFFEHAAKLHPENNDYLLMLLNALALSDPTEAQQRAGAVLQRAEAYSPLVVTRAVEIEFSAAIETPDSEARRVIQSLEPLLLNTVSRLEQPHSDAPRSHRVIALSLLGAAQEYLGNRQAAQNSYSKGLALEPHNHALLTARGILLYGISPSAIHDLEKATRAGSTLVWPYAALAHYYLGEKRFDECRKFCEQSLQMNGSNDLKSEIAEWLAIAMAQLGFPAERVEAAFEDSIRLDPTNERAKRNFAAFQGLQDLRNTDVWERRTAEEVRTSVFAKSRFTRTALSFGFAA